MAEQEPTTEYLVVLDDRRSAFRRIKVLMATSMDPGLCALIAGAVDGLSGNAFWKTLDWILAAHDARAGEHRPETGEPTTLLLRVLPADA